MKNKYERCKYEITCKCGHKETFWIGGYTEEYRLDMAKINERHVCTECRRKETAEKIEKFKLDLPKLNGTPKQVAWAEEIRNNIILECESEGIDYELLLGIESAEYFINNRNTKVKYLIDEIKLNNRIKAIKKEIDDTSFAELKGSKKQVSWAKDIRKNMIAMIKAETERTSEEELKTMFRCKTEEMLSFLENDISESTWFIDNNFIRLFRITNAIENSIFELEKKRKIQKLKEEKRKRKKERLEKSK